MGIFGSIMDKIFGREHAGAASSSGGGVKTASGDAAPAGTSSTGGQSVDVTAMLDGLASKAGQKLDWRNSIVDLLKLLGLDSSLTSRKELAQELHYTGDTSDSATMNIWLHKQVMTKLAENGGKVPDSLRT